MMVMMLGVLPYVQHNVVSVVTMVTGYEVAVARRTVTAVITSVWVVQTRSLGLPDTSAAMLLLCCCLLCSAVM